jgi:hypothetical protein
LSYQDEQEERMRQRVYRGAGMLAVTLDEMTKDRNKRIMGCRAPLAAGWHAPIGMYATIGISINIATTCDLIFEITFVPMIASMNRSIERAKENGNESTIMLLERSRGALKSLYNVFKALREASLANIDSYFNQWQTYLAQLGLDGTDSYDSDRGWSATEEEDAERARRARHAHKDRQQSQEEDSERGGNWPSFDEAGKMTGTEDFGKPRIPEE